VPRLGSTPNQVYGMRWTVGVLHDSIQEPSGPRVRKDGFSGGVHRSRGKVRARPSGRNTAKVMRPDRYSCRLAAYITTAWLPPPPGYHHRLVTTTACCLWLRISSCFHLSVPHRSRLGVNLRHGPWLHAETSTLVMHHFVKTGKPDLTANDRSQIQNRRCKIR
jgi:hypothetical protein